MYTVEKNLLFYKVQKKSQIGATKADYFRGFCSLCRHEFKNYSQ